jgi:hypothetical protein
MYTIISKIHMAKEEKYHKKEQKKPKKVVVK